MTVTGGQVDAALTEWEYYVMFDAEMVVRVIRSSFTPAEYLGKGSIKGNDQIPLIKIF